MLQSQKLSQSTKISNSVKSYDLQYLWPIFFIDNIGVRSNFSFCMETEFVVVCSLVDGQLDIGLVCYKVAFPENIAEKLAFLPFPQFRFIRYPH